MPNEQSFEIVEEQNVVDDHFFDIIGNEFKFSHEKGLAEWLKNSADAYRRMQNPPIPEEQRVLLRFTDGASKKKPTFECIDFGGMTRTDIDKAFKRWGDPQAATAGKQKKMFGGHGNGGKFYMRQMFGKSYFITYLNGTLNVFGFNENRKYGYAQGHQDMKISAKDALVFAGLYDILPANLRQKIIDGKCGFTVVRGIDPHKVKRKVRMNQLLQKIMHHPQARQVLTHMNVSCIHNDQWVAEKIEPEKIPPMPGFEEPFTDTIPTSVEIIEEGEGTSVSLANAKFEAGNIVLKTSAESLGTGRLADLNRIEIIGELGVIASYKMHELPLHHPEFADFIYGECRCPILEDPEDDCVKNDRTKLQEDNPKTKALLTWICQEVDALSDMMGEEQAKQAQQQGDKLSSEYNKVLNEWKNKMLNKLLVEIVGNRGRGVGVGIGEGGRLGEGSLGAEEVTGGEEGGAGGGDGDSEGGEGGEGGGEGLGTGGTGEKGQTDSDQDVSKGDKGAGEVKEGEGGGSEKTKGKKFTQVLLSGIDEDPVSGEVLTLPPQQPAVYQRPQDIHHGIYWINTARPLAQAIIDKHTRESAQWRNYLFQRYVDIFVKEALYALEENEVDLNIPQIDAEISKTIQKVHDFASQDLEHFLFDEQYKV